MNQGHLPVHLRYPLNWKCADFQPNCWNRTVVIVFFVFTGQRNWVVTTGLLTISNITSLLVCSRLGPSWSMPHDHWKSVDTTKFSLILYPFFTIWREPFRWPWNPWLGFAAEQTRLSSSVVLCISFKSNDPEHVVPTKFLIHTLLSLIATDCNWYTLFRAEWVYFLIKSALWTRRTWLVSQRGQLKSSFVVPTGLANIRTFWCVRYQQCSKNVFLIIKSFYGHNE